MIALIVGGAFSLLYSLLLTPLFIKGFKRLQWGQFIREDGPKSHYSKRGTATMGGIIFISGSVLGYLLGKLIAGDTPTASAWLVIFMAVGLGAVGFIDDFLKTHKQQSLGLGGWAKVFGQVLVAVVFALLSIRFANSRGLTPATPTISMFRDFPFSFMQMGLIVGLIVFIIWITLIVTATSNAVNVTDGLDGLATGASILAFSAYVIIGFWQHNEACAIRIEPGCYEVRDPLDLAAIAAAFIGGLIGFLWWNTSPARIYMGDTGSLGLGGAIAALAILTHTELLLILIGGLFIIETGSVIIQRVYFKITKGNRIFLMSPIHHHFELKGWDEVTVVVRFWIISGVMVLLGIALFYGEWMLQQ